MAGIRLYPIGRTECEYGEFNVRLDPKYKEALTGLKDFSHVLVLFWFDGCDNEQDRERVIEEKPYKNGPDFLGSFATRSPSRPNPIGVSVSEILEIDQENALIKLAYIDAMDGTPILDIKPYIPSADRVENVRVPDYQKNWPSSYEQSGDFNWDEVFNF